MLHRGWTLCVARDIVDNDWSVCFKPGVYLTMQEFINADGADILPNFVPSRDEALQKARAVIDLILDREP